MREPVKDRSRLEHILEAIDRILENTKGMSLEKLNSNDIFYYGLVKNIEIVGEAAYHLTKAFRDSHPETPWQAINVRIEAQRGIIEVPHSFDREPAVLPLAFL